MADGKKTDAELEATLKKHVAQDKAKTTGQIKGGLDRIKKATGADKKGK